MNTDALSQTDPTADDLSSTEGTQEARTPEPEGVREADAPDEPDTFPRDYVEKLRKESAEYRTKAKDRDDLAQRLHTALVEATGRLADPSDLDYDEAHLSDPEALTAAIESLLEAKPHLASRRPVGEIGQGPIGTDADVNLASLLRSNA